MVSLHFVAAHQEEQGLIVEWTVQSLLMNAVDSF